MALPLHAIDFSKLWLRFSVKYNNIIISPTVSSMFRSILPAVRRVHVPRRQYHPLAAEWSSSPPTANLVPIVIEQTVSAIFHFRQCAHVDWFRAEGSDHMIYSLGSFANE